MGPVTDVRLEDAAEAEKEAVENGAPVDDTKQTKQEEPEPETKTYEQAMKEAKSKYVQQDVQLRQVTNEGFQGRKVAPRKKKVDQQHSSKKKTKRNRIIMTLCHSTSLPRRLKAPVAVITAATIAVITDATTRLIKPTFLAWELKSSHRTHSR